MKDINLSEILTNVFFSALTAAMPAAFTVLLYYFSLNGAIDYSVSQDKQFFFVTFYVSNDRSEPADIEIGMSASIEAIVASSGTAGIEILNAAGRVGSILSITKIPPMSDYGAIVRSPVGVSAPVPSLVRAPTGVELHRANPPSGRINPRELILQFAIYFSLMFAAFTYFSKRINDTNKQLTEVKASVNSTGLISRRIKVYALGVVRYLNSENVFWRSIVERILVSEGTSKGKARQLLQMIGKRLGYKTPPDIEDEDLDFVIAMLIDEDKRKRFDEMTK
jgi:hypothetical protein